VSLSWTASTPGTNCTVQYRVFVNGTQATQFPPPARRSAGWRRTTYSFTVGAINEYGSSARARPSR